MPDTPAPASSDGDWPPAGCPPLAWPEIADETRRQAWYHAVIEAYAALWDGHPSAPVIAPIPTQALDALEIQLGHVLPASLRRYHQQFGALSLGETLRSAALQSDTPIAALATAWPSLDEMASSDAERIQAPHLVAFGDYLGNGNHLCYDARDGAVWYFDHDTAPHLTRFFDDPADYLDALMLLTLAEVHEDDAAGDALLRQRHGDALVDTWHS